MEDKIREAIKALQDKVSAECSMEVEKNNESIEQVAKEAYQTAKQAEVDKIYQTVYSKYKPALDVLDQFVGMTTEPAEEVTESKGEATGNTSVFNNLAFLKRK